MISLIEHMRSILGNAVFYSNGELDYGLMIEYLVGSLILICVICNVFKLLRVLFGG